MCYVKFTEPYRTRFIPQLGCPNDKSFLAKIITLQKSQRRLLTRVFLCGDTLLNGSLNAAMLSGERAAQGVIEVLEESPDLAQFTTEYLN